jgi:hypothetical protein
LPEHKLCGSSRKSERSFVSVYRVYFASSGYVKCRLLYKEEGLLLNISAFYSCEMALKVDIDVSFDNTYDWKAGEFTSTEVYTTLDETSR